MKFEKTKAQRARSALDPLLTRMTGSEAGRASDRSVIEPTGPRIFSAGLLMARSILDAGKDVGFSRWIHAAALSYHDPALGEGEVAGKINIRQDERLSASRQVSVRQGDRELATASVAFENPPQGRHHPHLYGIGDAPDPHTMPVAGEPATLGTLPADIRPIDWAPLSARERGLEESNRTWFRFSEELPDDLLVHSAALALCVDPLITRNLDGINDYNKAEGNPSVEGWRPITYSLWIHRCFRADDWILATEKTASVFGNRAFFAMTLKSSQGRHVASAVQELHLLRSDS